MADTTTTTTTYTDPLAAGISPSLIPDWINRRKVIFGALWFCAAMSGLIIITGCSIAFMGIFFVAHIESNVLSLLDSAVYTLAFVATSIIGSYVFGVNMDWANTRQHIAGLISSTITPPANLANFATMIADVPPVAAPPVADISRRGRKAPQ